MAKKSQSVKAKLERLHRFNLIMAGLHGVQALLVLALSTDFKLPILGNYLTFNEAARVLEPANKVLFEIPLVYLIVGFFGLSSLAHLIIATVYKKQYEKNLKSGINKARWIEYSLSASTMMVAISLLVGIYDFGSLVMIFGLTAIMNLLGLAMEVHNQNQEKPRWVTYWIGCLAGILPWVVIALYFWLSASEGAKPPTFVYWIFVSIFTFFNIFAINIVLQYKKVGKWADYLYGERAYIILSLVAKSALAWQVFAGTLRP
jgi:hypothetical protein